MSRKFLVAFLILLFAISVNAHLDAGEDVSVGSYVIDFGHSPEELVVGERVNVAFNLLDGQSMDSVGYESLWVRVSSGDDVLFAGNFFPESGNVLFSYVFSNQGVHEISVKFRNGSDVLAENSFEVFVGKSEEEGFGGINPRFFFYAVLIALLALLVVKSKLFKLPKIRDKS